MSAPKRGTRGEFIYARPEEIMQIVRNACPKMVRSDRFFPATALAGRLHLRDIGARSLWDSARIGYVVEQFVNVVLTRFNAQKVWTVEELDAALGESKDKPGTIDLYLHESLLNEVH